MAESTRKSPPRKAGSGRRRKPAATPIDPEKVAAAKAAKRAETEAAAARKAAQAARLARKKRQRRLTYGAIGLVIVDVCPTEEAYRAFSTGPGFREARRRHEIPDPTELHDYPVHAAFVDGARPALRA